MKRLGLLLLLMVLPLAASATDSYNLGANVVTAGNYVQQMAANTNLTGTDTISLANGSQKLTLTANETLTIQKGSLPVTPSATSLLSVNFQICQFASANCTGPSAPVACCTGSGTGCGNDTLAFAAGTGITNFEWSGAGSTSPTVGQPGYTLTQGHGDSYSCSFDNTSLTCAETMSDQPC